VIFGDRGRLRFSFDQPTWWRMMHGIRYSGAWSIKCGGQFPAHWTAINQKVNEDVGYAPIWSAAFPGRREVFNQSQSKDGGVSSICSPTCGGPLPGWATRAR